MRMRMRMRIRIMAYRAGLRRALKQEKQPLLEKLLSCLTRLESGTHQHSVPGLVEKRSIGTLQPYQP